MTDTRNMLFISHANPEDNEVARWLALRLAADGYPVWCDLTKLLGGEPFWQEIEKAIRERTCKFLFPLSQHSNEKQGTLDELSLAATVFRLSQTALLRSRLPHRSSQQSPEFRMVSASIRRFRVGGPKFRPTPFTDPAAIEHPGSSLFCSLQLAANGWPTAYPDTMFAYFNAKSIMQGVPKSVPFCSWGVIASIA